MGFYDFNTADIWEEKLNEAETDYFVDNEWRKLEVIKETIKIKSQPDQVLDVKLTHRGPVIPFRTL